MEPTIYKPGAYNTPGVYKGAGGIYKGRGVYNDGAGGGSPIPPEYTRYDWIRFDGASSTHTWFPATLINIDTNENCNFEFVYNAMLMNDYASRMVFSVSDSYGGMNIVLFQLQNYGTKTNLQLFKNGGSIAYPSEKPGVSYCKTKSHLSILNDQIIDESVLSTTPASYSVISLQNRYLNLVPPESKQLKSYGGKITKNDIILYEFIPVKENDTGKCGFYDIVNNVFTTFTDPAAISHWTAGNDT